jgi:transposase
MLLALEVREAMDQLPESQRQTLILYSEEGLSYTEIADIMDVSIGTVKSRLFYAKKNLRGLIRPATLDVLAEEFSEPPKKSNANSVTSAEYENLAS